jgi:23S rRNA (uracil1939-C5)-methyltransferase
MKPHTKRTAPAQPVTGHDLSAPQLVQMDKPVYGGSFLTRVEGKAVFVPLVLPGEEVRIRVSQQKHSYTTAEAEEIVTASGRRIAPLCPHFSSCGGCHYQHADYATQLGFKQAILRETMQRAGVPAPDEIGVLSADPWRYRNRIRLAFDAAGRPGYRGLRSHAVIPVNECPIAAPVLIEAARAFAEIAHNMAPNLRPAETTLFCNADESSLQASIVVAGNNGRINFDELASAWQQRTPELAGAELSIASRNGQPPRTVSKWGAESLLYRAAGFDYRVDRGAFFQVNRWLVDALVERVTASQNGELAWDLFAGVGLFARKLTASFQRVVAVESAPSATQAQAANLKWSCGVPVRSSTLEFLRNNCRKNDSRTPDLVAVDPPRAGLGSETCTLLAKVAAPAIAYVSCDPATLARDLHELTQAGYAINSVTLVDLFPQTFHMETLVHLRRA